MVSVSRRVLWESALDSKLVLSTSKQHLFQYIRSSIKTQRMGAILQEGALPPGKRGLEKAKGIPASEPGLSAMCETMEKTNKITLLRVWLGG